MKITIKLEDKRGTYSNIKSMWIKGHIQFENGETTFTDGFFCDDVSALEEFEESIESLLTHVKDFKREHYPEQEEE